MNPPPRKIEIHYGNLQPTHQIDHFLNSENYDARRRGNLVRRAKITMNRFINETLTDHSVPNIPDHPPVIYLTSIEVRGQQQILASVIRFDRVTNETDIVLAGDLYLASADEKDQLVRYLQTHLG